MKLRALLGAWVLAAATLVLSAGCGAEVEAYDARPNPDGLTAYCTVCQAEVHPDHDCDPKSEATHFRSVWCPVCRVQSDPRLHRHGITQYCPECRREVAFKRAGHVDHKTAWCATCGREAKYDEKTGLWAGHIHKRTVYCPDCDLEVRAAEDGGLHDSHVHGETQFCPECNREVALGLEGHMHGRTEYCAICKREVGRNQVNHHHGDTSFCDVCQTDMADQPPAWNKPDALRRMYENAMRGRGMDAQTKDFLLGLLEDDHLTHDHEGSVRETRVTRGQVGDLSGAISGGTPGASLGSEREIIDRLTRDLREQRGDGR